MIIDRFWNCAIVSMHDTINSEVVVGKRAKADNLAEKRERRTLSYAEGAVQSS